MTREDYCSFEISKLLKEKGFNEPCQAYWRIFENGDRVHTTFAPNENHNEAKGFISMPTHQMAMKWLREKGLFIEIHISELGNSFIYFITIQNEYGVWGPDSKVISSHAKGVDFLTYREAVEAALKYCLIKLI